MVRGRRNPRGRSPRRRRVFLVWRFVLTSDDTITRSNLHAGFRNVFLSQQFICICRVLVLCALMAISAQYLANPGITSQRPLSPRAIFGKFWPLTTQTSRCANQRNLLKYNLLVNLTEQFRSRIKGHDLASYHAMSQTGLAS